MFSYKKKSTLFNFSWNNKVIYSFISVSPLDLVEFQAVPMPSLPNLEVAGFVEA